MTKKEFIRGKPFTIVNDPEADIYHANGVSSTIVTQHGRFKANVVSVTDVGFTFNANLLSRRMEGYLRFSDLTIVNT